MWSGIERKKEKQKEKRITADLISNNMHTSICQMKIGQSNQSINLICQTGVGQSAAGMSVLR